MERLWVVECQYKDKSWGICHFTELPYTSINYFMAYQYKRALQLQLRYRCATWWTPENFRVRAYKGVQR